MREFPVPEPSKLNLVALMDIFTILVFFLMVNSSHVEVMEGDSSMKLPSAFSDQIAGPTLKMTVIDNAILIQGRAVVDLKAIDLTSETIPSLVAELEYQGKKNAVMSAEEQALGRAITLFADEALPYEVLRLVLASCASTDYRNVSLAVEGLTMKTSEQSESEQGVVVDNV